MSAPSDRAEVSSLRAQIDELSRRVTAVADRYGDTADSAIAADLYKAERALLTAVRSLDAAETRLGDGAG